MGLWLGEGDGDADGAEDGGGGKGGAGGGVEAVVGGDVVDELGGYGAQGGEDADEGEEV